MQAPSVIVIVILTLTFHLPSMSMFYLDHEPRVLPFDFWSRVNFEME